MADLTCPFKAAAAADVRLAEADAAGMAQKQKTQEIVSKLRQAQVLTGQGKAACRVVLEIPLREVGIFDIMMTLSLDKPIRPSDYLPNGDSRTLGVFIYSVTVLSAEQET